MLRRLGLGLVAIVLAAALVNPPALSVAVAARTKAPATTAAKSPAKPQAEAPPAPIPTGPVFDTDARNALVIEMDTDTVLFDKAAEQRIPPASMTKMMTAYIVFGMLKDGRAKLTDELPVSEKAWRTGGSKMFVPLGGKISVDDLLKGVLVQSGNDACIVLAEGLAGSEEAFVELMNAKARTIGLKDSHFVNVTGLPDPNHWMTARDLATLAIRTIKDFPEYYHYYSDVEFAFDNIKQGNRNPLLYKNLGADGLKTGHTEEAGYCLTGSVKRGDRRIVFVLAGMPTMRARAQESERVAEWAFREFSDYRLFNAGDKVDAAPVWLGTEPNVPLTIDHGMTITLPRDARKNMKVTVSYDSPVPAPVVQGQRLAMLTVTAPGMAAKQVPLVAAASVGRLGPFGRMATMAGYLVWGNHH